MDERMIIPVANGDVVKTNQCYHVFQYPFRADISIKNQAIDVTFMDKWVFEQVNPNQSELVQSMLNDMCDDISNSVKFEMIDNMLAVKVKMTLFEYINDFIRSISGFEQDYASAVQGLTINKVVNKKTLDLVGIDVNIVRPNALTHINVKQEIF